MTQMQKMLAPLKGLILAGGDSARMGQPKALMEYHGQAQYRHLAGLMRPFCSEVWVSCRAEQSHLFPDMPLIFDQETWGRIGPINGVCSAFAQKNTSWLVIGCDYVLLQSVDIEHLIANRAPDRHALAFANDAMAAPEPLIAVYEADLGPFLLKWLSEGNTSLRRFLSEMGVHLLQPQEAGRLKSFDYPVL